MDRVPYRGRFPLSLLNMTQLRVWRTSAGLLGQQEGPACGWYGWIPTDFSRLPFLQTFDVGQCANLSIDTSATVSFPSSLVKLSLDWVDFRVRARSGSISDSAIAWMRISDMFERLLPARYTLAQLSMSNCRIYGPVPPLIQSFTELAVIAAAQTMVCGSLQVSARAAIRTEGTCCSDVRRGVASLTFNAASACCCLLAPVCHLTACFVFGNTHTPHSSVTAIARSRHC